MSRFIRSVLAQNEAVVVSSVVTYDLPVNPVSHILFTMKCLNDTGTIANYSVMQALLAQVAKVEVLYKGQAIISGSLQDLMMLTYHLLGAQPYGCNFIKTNNAVRSVTVVIPLTRVLFALTECFPATSRGELQLQVTYAAAQTGIDTLIAQIETVELPDAKPVQFIKSTTSQLTPTSTGWFDFDLPLGNNILGVQIFGTTVPTGASYNASDGQIKVLVNNLEYGYSMANWESVHGEQLIKRPHLWLNEHIHRGNFTTTVEGDTGDQQEVDTLIQNYAYLDFDPLGDGSYAIQTTAANRVNLRINQQPAADLSRYMPVELVKVGTAF